MRAQRGIRQGKDDKTASIQFLEALKGQVVLSPMASKRGEGSERGTDRGGGQRQRLADSTNSGSPGTRTRQRDRDKKQDSKGHQVGYPEPLKI